MAKNEGTVKNYNKISANEYPKDYYTGDVNDADGKEEFTDAMKDLEQSTIAKLNKKLKSELEKGNKPKFKLKK
jgi:hypothetical protein